MTNRTKTTDPALTSRLLIALATPFALLVVVGALLTLQIVQMQRAAEWVARSDEIVAKIYDFQRQIIDQETGLRGYLVTEDRRFLEPYDRARPLETFTLLRTLLAGNASQIAQADEVLVRYERWLALSRAIVEPGASVASYQTRASMRERKDGMDAVRDSITRFLAAEEDLHRARVVSANSAYQTALFGLLPVLLALGGILSLVSRSQLRSIAETYTSALNNERDARDAAETQSWLRLQQMGVSKAAEGDVTLDVLALRVLDALVRSTGAVVGALYLGEPGGWRRRAGHALDVTSPVWFADGEGQIGRAGAGTSLLHLGQVPGDYLRVRSATGERAPAEVVIVPASVEQQTLAVFELGFFGEVERRHFELFERVGETIATAIRSAGHKLRLRELLEESQRQGEELQTQQEELRVSNEELQQQSDALRLAQAQLEERKEELEATNSSLVEQRNALERAQTALGNKADELTRANRYKSEFLANMSHELRTPLNSSLILAKLLADNKDGNLSEEQIKFAKTIEGAGNDLLLLINDILDLSKIEAGKLEVHAEPTTLGRLIEPIVRTMEPFAAEKKLGFSVVLPDDSVGLETDPQRTQQILLNLLSNAFKFTEVGTVTLGVATFDDRVEISVRDTGIGIPFHQHDVIFDAFRQADGTTNRKYGGTGLGLSISRDLARLLGGDLRVDSDVGRGSSFTLILPRIYPGPRAAPARKERRAAPVVGGSQTGDAAPSRTPGTPGRAADSNGSTRRRVLLIVEDDEAFADILVNIGNELEFECVVAHGADDAVKRATEHVPSAIVLDMKLPDHSGLSVLDRLKRDPTTRHVPIHVISVDDQVQAALSMGAIGYLRKPVAREDVAAVLRKLKEPLARLRRLLVVEDDATQRDAIVRLLAAPDLEIVPVATVREALARLGEGTFDCVVTDLTLPDASGYDLLETMAKDDAYSFPPVVVYTGRSLTADEEQRLRRYSSAIIVKGAKSPERLLDEITLFLHRVEAAMPPDRQRMLRQVRDREAVFDGRKVLLAEDDVRNIFALTSVLEPRGVKLIVARNGKEALDRLQENPDVDLVLMDIMMPEMDGIRATEEIRRRSGPTSNVPIIALTAKAMRDDQERCLRAGANDYVPKPLDVEVLLSLMRVWMRR